MLSQMSVVNTVVSVIMEVGLRSRSCYYYYYYYYYYNYY